MLILLTILCILLAGATYYRSQVLPILEIRDRLTSRIESIHGTPRVVYYLVWGGPVISATMGPDRHWEARSGIIVRHSLSLEKAVFQVMRRVEEEL